MRDLAAGIDSSTQSCTVLLRRLEDGAPVAEARAPHPPTTPPLSEQDPEAWWQALLACLRDLTAYLPRIACLSVGGQGHGLVLLDAAGRPIRPAKLWNDTESAPDAARLLALRPAADWARLTGSIPAPALTVAKLAWTERRHPGLVARADRVLLPADYLVFRLTGRAVTERGGGSGTGYLDPARNAWVPELAELAVPGIDWPRVLPEIIGSAEPAGVVTAAELGPLAGATVGAGSGDNMTAALGMDARPGDRVISLGTSGTIYGVTPVGVRDVTGRINGYADATGLYMPMVTTLNAAKVTDTFRRLMDLTTDAFDALALGARSDGLVLLPYLDGERCPNLPEATGHLIGLRSDTSRGQMARAVAEGPLCGLLAGGDLLAAEGVVNDGRLILTGGASRSAAYRQVLADLSGSAVLTCRMVETAAGGAAVQAAAALTGRPTAEVAAAWAPVLDDVAAPGPGAAQAEAVRGAYRAAFDRHVAEVQVPPDPIPASGP